MWGVNELTPSEIGVPADTKTAIGVPVDTEMASSEAGTEPTVHSEILMTSKEKLYEEAFEEFKRCQVHL